MHLNCVIYFIRYIEIIILRASRRVPFIKFCRFMAVRTGILMKGSHFVSIDQINNLFFDLWWPQVTLKFKSRSNKCLQQIGCRKKPSFFSEFVKLISQVTTRDGIDVNEIK